MIHQDTILPKKINNNIILIYSKKKKTISFKNLSFFISYLVKKLSLVKFSIKKFFYVTSSFVRKAELINSIIEKELNLKSIKSVLLPYEGQPYENFILKSMKKNNSDIITKGYDHSAPHSIPLHIYYIENTHLIFYL